MRGVRRHFLGDCRFSMTLNWRHSLCEPTSETSIITVWKEMEGSGQLICCREKQIKVWGQHNLAVPRNLVHGVTVPKLKKGKNLVQTAYCCSTDQKGHSLTACFCSNISPENREGCICHSYLVICHGCICRSYLSRSSVTVLPFPSYSDFFPRISVSNLQLLAFWHGCNLDGT